MIRILTGVKVRHAPCGAILRRITASKGSKGEPQAGKRLELTLGAHNAHMWALWASKRFVHMRPLATKGKKGGGWR